MRENKFSGKYLTLSTEEHDSFTFERVTLRPGVRVFGISKNKILLIKEYRKLENQSRWRFISGWIDKDNKTELDHAKEELSEEACMMCDQWEKFYVSDSQGGTVEERRVYFIAHDPQPLEICPINPDIDIVEETKWVDIDELWRMIDAKEIQWTSSVMVAIQALKQYGK